MSRARLTSLSATIRPRAVRIVRDLRVRWRRHPVTADVVPRPPQTARATRRMHLTNVLAASDLNPYYLRCWPLTRKAWAEVAGLEPHLVLIAPAGEVPEELRDDPQVHVVEPLPGLHTAFQAQCIRLLYPALLDVEGAVLTSDVDMVPVNGRYFHSNAGRIDARHFLAYRDVLLWGNEIPICYNAAQPRTWAEVFEVATLADVRDRLAAWGDGLVYDGKRGGEGWDTDQVMLYKTLVARGRTRRDVWILDDRYALHSRLDGAMLGADGRGDAIRRRIECGVYADYHFLHPFEDFRERNEAVVELAIRTARGRR